MSKTDHNSLAKNGTAATQLATCLESQPVTTRTGLRLHMRRLKPTEASRHRDLALMPYYWTYRQFAKLVANSWQLSLACLAAGTAVSWKTRSPWPWLLGALTPLALAEPALCLLLWLASTRRLQDYDDFSGFWTGRNCLYGAFVVSGDEKQPMQQQEEDPVATVASLHIDSETCELQRLAVVDQFRGQGIGEAVCGRLMALCQARGYRRMQLATTALQRHAVRIYESLGFARRGQFFTAYMPGIAVYRYEIRLGSEADDCSV